MYWILFVMAAIAAVVIALIVGGLATPREHVVARAIVAPATAEVVWGAIRQAIVDGSMSFTIKEESTTRLVADRLDDNLQPAAAWTWSVQPTDARARITVIQRGSVGNPIARFIASFTGHHRHVDRHLRELAERLGAGVPNIESAAVEE